MSEHGPDSVNEESEHEGDDVVIELSNDSIVVDELEDESKDVSTKDAEGLDNSGDADVVTVESVEKEKAEVADTPEEAESEAPTEEEPVVNELAAALEKRLAEAEERESAGEQAVAPKEPIVGEKAKPVVEEKTGATEDLAEDIEIDDEEEKENISSAGDGPSHESSDG